MLLIGIILNFPGKIGNRPMNGGEAMPIARSRKSKMKKTPPEMERMKLEIAEELGLLDKVRDVGWAGLSAKETGRVGGLLMKKRRDAAEKAKTE